MRMSTAWMLVLALTATVAAQEVVIDNSDSGFSVISGTWIPSTTATTYWGSNYLYAATSTGGSNQVEWRPALPEAGDYEVAVWYTSGANRTTNAPYTVNHSAGSVTQRVNQQIAGGQWVVLGSYPFNAGDQGFVRLGTDATPSFVIADAVRFRRVTPTQFIAHNDPRIGFGGLFFARVETDAVYLERFSPAALQVTNPTRALNTTGVTVRLRTNSRQVRAHFIELPSFNLGNTFGVFQDGQFDQSVSDLIVDAQSHSPGAFVTFEIACPSYARVAFTGLEIDADAALAPAPPERRPRYAAFGDSITHGYGQGSASWLTYPWQLAQARKWELFNLAVSASKVIPEFGSMLDSEPLDVVTVLWGQNDWKSENDLPRFNTRYRQFLAGLRAAHPGTGIYCITLIAPLAGTPSADHGYSREDYRQAVRDIVSDCRAAGDSNMFVLEGMELTTDADLQDGIHLNLEGAARFAEHLAAAIPLPGPSGIFLDFDRDGDIDGVDVESLAACLSAPDTPLKPGCQERDTDRDGDVDQSDFGLLQRCLSTTGTIDRDCMD